DQGCERVGCIAGPLDRADARARLDGYRLAHDRAGRPVDEALIAHGRFSRASGLPAGAELFEKGVDGIFASNDEMAVGAILSGARSGFRVPDDVLVVGFDGTAFDEVIEPTITSVIQPFDEIGRTAVELLNKLVHGEAGLTSVSIVPPLVQGGSTTRP
ncbi:MAG: substrate-binding domain-containing protein, partial [Ilumatobacter fluminis]